MSTIKAIPRKEGDRIFCYELVEKPKRTGNNTVSERHDRQKFEEYEQRVCAAKTYPILPTDSAWFEEKLGQVVDVEISNVYEQQVNGESFTYISFTQYYAIPPKQDLCKCDQYLQMQVENERLKGLIELLHDNERQSFYIRNGYPNEQINKFVEIDWQQFKTEHKL